MIILNCPTPGCCLPAGHDYACSRGVGMDAAPSPKATPTEGRGPSPAFWVYIDKARMSPDIATSKGWLDKALAEVGRTNPGGAPSLDKLREAVELEERIAKLICSWFGSPESEWKDFEGNASEVIEIIRPSPPAGVDAGLREALGLARRLEEVANALNGETFIPINPTTLHAAARHIRSLAARPHPEEQGAVDLDAFEAAVREEVNAGYMHSVQSPEYKAAKEKLDGLRAKLRRPEEQGEAPDLEALLRVGGQMANAFFNLNQRPETASVYFGREDAKEVQKEWDRLAAIVRRSRTPSQAPDGVIVYDSEHACRDHCTMCKNGPRTQGGANG